MGVGFFDPETKMLFGVISRAYEHRSLMLIANLAFEESIGSFGSERLTGVPLRRSLTAGKSWKPMEKVTGFGRPGNNLSGNLLHGRT